MKNITNLSELLEIDNNIECRRRSPIVGIVLAVAGAAMLVASYLTKESAQLSTLLFTIGFIVLAAGIIVALGKRYRLSYRPTGEKISCRKMLFDPKERGRLYSCISKGDLDTLQSFSTSQSSSLMAILYTTPSGSISIVQVQEYVPHQYEPSTEPVIYHKQLA
ncbi:MAG: hypothetical protein SOZ00_08120 [Tidjanibacter sp.]|nr:hypothetical protein [Tidjanibacter sp.]